MKWTNQEESVIRKTVRENPENLRKAFILCSEKINRTPNAIRIRWYAKVSKTNPCFVTISSKKGTKNRKISNSKNISMTQSLWHKILNIFKN